MSRRPRRMIGILGIGTTAVLGLLFVAYQLVLEPKELGTRLPTLSAILGPLLFCDLALLGALSILPEPRDTEAQPGPVRSMMGLG